MSIWRLYLFVAGLVAAMFVVVAPAWSATNNFEFVVEAKPGLKLEFIGYDKSGVQRFRVKAEPEFRKGKVAYVARVDEAIIFARPIAKWCVTDATGKWAALPEGTNELCDEHPRDNGGSFLFAVTPPPAEQPMPLLAGAEGCVQEALGTLGYFSPQLSDDPAEATRRAAIRFVAFQDKDPGLPLFSKKTAQRWCDTLVPLVAGKQATPLPEAFARTSFGPDVSVEVARDSAAGLIESRDYLVAKTGFFLKAAPAVYISSDAEWLTGGYAAETDLPERDRASRTTQFAACNGGEANLGMLYMCASSKVFSEDWYGGGVRSQRAYALAHEYVHVMQMTLAGPTPPGCCDEQQQVQQRGPVWLVEGAAEYLAFLLLRDGKRMDFTKEMTWQIKNAQELGLSLKELETRSGFSANPSGSAVSMVAAHDLVGRRGADGLMAFWQNLEDDKPWEEAFEKSFGISVAAFYEEFENADPAFVTPREAVACVQKALNALGFDAGAPDGVLGRGTKAAFAKYAEANQQALGGVNDLDEKRSASLCLHFARKQPIDTEADAVAERLAKQATMALAITSDADAKFRVVLADKAGRGLHGSSLFTPLAERGEIMQQVRFPYYLAREASMVCLKLEDGWRARHRTGKEIGATPCQAIDPAIGTLGLVLPFIVEPVTAD